VSVTLWDVPDQTSIEGERRSSGPGIECSIRVM
jgi:hypothetical protein